MRVRNVQRRSGEDIELQMTPMIDIVFQLLVFFVMTFKLVLPEGDFSVKMPQLTDNMQGEPDDTLLPITVRLVSDRAGNIAEIRFNDRVLADANGRPSFPALRAAVLKEMGPDPLSADLENLEVKLDGDYELNFENTMEAFTAVSGFVVEAGPHRGEIVPLIQNVNFAPPRAPR
ncbi:MAG: ExbD/TolR family protein [Planctomycetota bacterium]|jgi:biopolymer transport protein ExbD